MSFPTASSSPQPSPEHSGKIVYVDPEQQVNPIETAGLHDDFLGLYNGVLEGKITFGRGVEVGVNQGVVTLTDLHRGNSVGWGNAVSISRHMVDGEPPHLAVTVDSYHQEISGSMQDSAENIVHKRLRVELDEWGNGTAHQLTELFDRSGHFLGGTRSPDAGQHHIKASDLSRIGDAASELKELAETSGKKRHLVASLAARLLHIGRR